MLFIVFLITIAYNKNFLSKFLTFNNYVSKLLKNFNLAKKFFNILSNIYYNWPASLNLPSFDETLRVLKYRTRS